MTILQLVYLLLLLFPIAYLNTKLDLPLNKKMLYATTRMILQLSLIGVFLAVLFEFNNPIVNLSYAFFMMLVAGFSIMKSTQLNYRIYSLPVIIAVVIPNLLVLIFFNQVVVGLDNILDARHLVPVAGMLLGNSLSGNIICINNFYNQLRDNERSYYYILGVSASRTDALKPFFRNAVLSSANPTLASMETIGLVSLPGMMTGQILGGALPLTAIKYQIAIMVAIFISRYCTAILSLWLTQKKAFDDYDRLIL